ncbi:MAG: peptidoglycan bridge formation glycyltransferase FemA/FemB family protein, partial [Erysipelotrichaceae bacterium]|nr:peptidoglycan bridge formation glycyltransferase FemA/FemB family protein [Erysipelotrichaceae bacterium]
MAFTFETQMNPEEFDTFVASHPLGNLLQQTNWAKIKNNWGHFFTGVKEDGNIVLTALVLRTKKMGMELWYIPRGPVTDYTRKDILDFYFSNLKKFAKPYKVICVKFDPLVIYDSFLLADHTESKTTKDDTTKLLESLGAKHLGYTFRIAQSTQPRTQAVYYYSDGWTERPSKTLKKYLQRCSNKGVTLEKGTPGQISVFADILAKTGERKGIHLRSEEYFRRMTEVYGENCAIFFSKLNQKEQLEKNLAEKKRIEDDLAENPRSEKKMEP